MAVEVGVFERTQARHVEGQIVLARLGGIKQAMTRYGMQRGQKAVAWSAG